jgi:hypothetical protein
MMSDLADQVIATLSLLFNPFIVLATAVLIVLGCVAAPRIGWMVTCVFGLFVVAAYLLWTYLFVFPYPPGSSSKNWMIAGYKLTEAASNLVKELHLENMARSDRSSKLVFNSGGDVNAVWEGSSIDFARISGQVIACWLAFSVGTLIKLSPAKKKS